MTTTTTPTYAELRDDYCLGENKQQHRTADGDHLFLVTIREMKHQREVYDGYCGEYKRQRQGNINPLSMHKAACAHVAVICGRNNYVTA